MTIRPGRHGHDTWNTRHATMAIPAQTREIQVGRAPLLAFLRGLDEALETVLAIGHNPALEQAAHLLAPDGDAAALERLRGTYPTAALATVDARDDGARWADLGPGWGRLTAFTRPCDLTAPS